MMTLLKKTLLIIACTICAITAAAQKIKADNPVIDLGQVEYLQPTTATFTLKNTGRKPLAIQKVDTGCNCSVAEYPTHAIPAGEKFDIRITYDARLMGHFDKIIDIYSNASPSPTSIELRGVVVEEVDDFIGRYHFQLGTLVADTNIVNFGDIPLGEIATQHLRVYNPTSKIVTPQLLHLPSYIKAEFSPSSLPPGRSATATLTLDSRFMRNFGYNKTIIYLVSELGERTSTTKQVEAVATLLPEVKTLTPSEQVIAPHITLSASSVSLSTSGNKKSATIDIQNTGHSRLSIHDVRVLSEGFQLSINKRTLSPSEIAKLKIKIDTKRYHPDSTPPRIVLITNDPEQPKVTIDINIL